MRTKRGSIQPDGNYYNDLHTVNMYGGVCVYVDAGAVYCTDATNRECYGQATITSIRKAILDAKALERTWKRDMQR